MIAVVQSSGIDQYWGHALALFATAVAHLGEASNARDRVRESEESLDALVSRGFQVLGRAFVALGRASLVLRRVDDAQRLAERALDSSGTNPGYTADALHLLGDVAAHPDAFDPSRAEERYRAALALAEPRGMRPLVAHCHLGLGNLYGRMGKRDQAQEHLTTATTMYREMDMRFWLEQAEVEMGGRA